MFASSSIALLISAVAVVASDHSARNHRGLASRLDQMSKRGSFSGRATWYPTDTGADACTGKNHLDSDYFIAMNVPQFDNDGCCGKQVKISYNGKSAVATCVDECASCPSQGQIDLTKGLFSYLTDGNLDLGEFTATWSYVDGNDDDDSSPTTTKKTTTTKATPKPTTQAAPKVTTTHTTHHTTSTPKPEPTEEVKTTSKKVEVVSSTTKHSSSAKPTSSASSVKPSSSAVPSSSATPISLSIPAASSSEASSALPTEGVANVGSGSTSSAADTSSDSSGDNDSDPASGALGGVSQGASSGAASIGSNKLTAALAALALVALQLL